MRSCWISLRSHRILLGLMGFQVFFAGELQIPPIFVSFCRKSFEYRRRFLVLWFGWVAWVLGRKPANRLEVCRVLWVATCNRRRSGRFGWFLVRVRAGWSVLRVGWTVLIWFNCPCKRYHLFSLHWSIQPYLLISIRVQSVRDIIAKRPIPIVDPCTCRTRKLI